jgi:predicted GNAT family acetyltransferase
VLQVEKSNMNLQTCSTADEFLSITRTVLEADEATNGLMYGLALNLLQFPERIFSPPYFGAVFEEDALQAAALMTPPHNLIVLSIGSAPAGGAFDLLARSLSQAGWTVPGVLGPSLAALAFARAWQALTGEPYSPISHQRVFELRQVIPPNPAPGKMRIAMPEQLELITSWLQQFHIDATTGDRSSLDELRRRAQFKIQDQSFFLWDDGGAVALAGRTRPTPHGCSVGPVYTPLEFRRKGYATALTAALSQRLLDEGFSFTSLFTDLNNPVSNSIYQKIGYRPVCDFDEYGFGNH